MTNNNEWWAAKFEQNIPSSAPAAPQLPEATLFDEVKIMRPEAFRMWLLNNLDRQNGLTANQVSQLRAASPANYGAYRQFIGLATSPAQTEWTNAQRQFTGNWGSRSYKNAPKAQDGVGILGQTELAEGHLISELTGKPIGKRTPYHQGADVSKGKRYDGGESLGVADMIG